MPVDLFLIGQPQVGFMHQRSALERNAGRLMLKTPLRKHAQFVIDDGDQALQGVPISSTPVR
jgi:hypothetical protein